MNITVTKEAFGPFKISAVKSIAKEEQPRYLELGALYEMERKPASAAEKLFWTEQNAKGELVRGSFKRNDNIPATDKAAAQITAVLVEAGYSDVTVTVRETTEAGPAWKTKVAAYIGLMELDEEMTPERVRTNIEKLCAKLSLDTKEVMAYAKSKGLK